jgi:hypothetical protein
MYADITLETVALSILNNVAVFVTDARLPFSDFFHGLSLNTITNALTQALQSVNKWKKSIHCCQLSSFNVAYTNSVPQFLSVSIIFPRPVYVAVLLEF